MQNIHEITRPIIARISLDGELEIPISYAYDLYKPEIVAHFSRNDILTQWRALVETANRDTYVRHYFEQLINRGWQRVDSLNTSFWENLHRSNLELVHRQSQTVEFGDILFEELLGKQELLTDNNNDRLYAVCSWYGYAVDLVHHLEDTTATFGQADVDFFAANVNDLLSILGWRDEITARLAD